MFMIKYPLRSASRKASLAVSQIGEKETNYAEDAISRGVASCHNNPLSREPTHPGEKY